MSNQPLDPAHKPAHLLALVGILLLAAWLRLGYLDLVEFKQDEVQHLRLAERVLNGDLALTGSSASVGIPKPPGMTYLMAIPLALSRDPRLISGFIALLNLGAVALCYYKGRRYFDPLVGLAAALCYAVSPWAILYGRKVFTADVLAPLIALTMAALLAAIVERKRWGWTLGVLGLAALGQITFSTVALIPGFVLLLWLYRRRIEWSALIVGVTLGALSFAPYLYAGLTQGFLRFWEGGGLGAGESASGAPWLAWRYALQLGSGANLNALAGESYERFLAGRLPGQWLDIILQLVCLLALGYVVARAWRLRRERPAWVVLALWTVLPILFDMLPWTTLYPHYLVVLYPAWFLVLGAAAVGLWRWAKSRWARATLGVVCALLLVWQGYNLLYLYRFIDRHPTEGGHGQPAHYALDAAARLQTLAQAKNVTSLLVMADGDDLRWDRTAAVMDFLLDDQDVRVVDGSQTLVVPSPDAPAALLWWPAAGKRAADWTSEYGRAAPSLDLPLRPGEGTARFFLWPSQPLDRDWPLRQEQFLVWTNGIELLGVDLVEQPDELAWTIGWQVNVPPPANVDYHWFVHLLDAQGQQISQWDGVPLPTTLWRQGEQVLMWGTLPRPSLAGPYTLRLGMYTWPELRNVTVMDIAANPAGEYIELGPIGLGRDDG